MNRTNIVIAASLACFICIPAEAETYDCHTSYGSIPTQIRFIRAGDHFEKDIRQKREGRWGEWYGEGERYEFTLILENDYFIRLYMPQGNDIVTDKLAFIDKKQLKVFETSIYPWLDGGRIGIPVTYESCTVSN